MDWNAIGAIGEIVGATAVVMTIGYLAVQVKHARTAANDVNRLRRASGIRDWQSLRIGDSGLREASTKTDSDVQELRHLISNFYSTPPMITVWKGGFYTNLLDSEFVDFFNAAIGEQPTNGA